MVENHAIGGGGVVKPDRLTTTATIRAKSTGRVVDYTALKDRGELIDASRIRSFFMTTTLPDVIVKTWELCQEVDPSATLATLRPNSAVSASLVLMMASPRFEIQCFRYLKRGLFPLNPFAAEFGKNYDVQFRLESPDEKLHQRFLEHWRTDWEVYESSPMKASAAELPPHSPPTLAQEYESADVRQLIENWRGNPEAEEFPALSAAPFRGKVYAHLHPNPTKEDRLLLLRCFERETDYRKVDLDGRYYDYLYWCALLLYQIGRVEDCLPMWRTKTSVSQDVQVGLDIQFLVGAGVEETLAFLNQSEDPHSDDAARYIEGCREAEDFSDMGSWLEGQIAMYGEYVERPTHE